MKTSARWLLLFALAVVPAILLSTPVPAASGADPPAASQEPASPSESSAAAASMTIDASMPSVLLLPLGGELLPPGPKEQCAVCVGEGPWVDPYCTETRCPIHERNCEHYCTQTRNSEVAEFSCTGGGHSLYCECADGTFQSCSC